MSQAWFDTYVNKVGERAVKMSNIKKVEYGTDKIQSTPDQSNCKYY